MNQQNHNGAAPASSGAKVSPPKHEQIERLNQIARAICFAEKRRGGAALFYLPDDETGEPCGAAVLISSPVVCAWITKKYEQEHGEPVSRAALSSWKNGVRFMSYAP